MHVDHLVKFCYDCALSERHIYKNNCAQGCHFRSQQPALWRQLKVQKSLKDKYKKGFFEFRMTTYFPYVAGNLKAK